MQRCRRGRRVRRCKRAPLENHAHNRSRENHQADRGRHVEHQHQRQPVGDRTARGAVVVPRRVVRNGRQRGGGNRYAEQPDRQVHQPERIVQPGHGAGALARREHRVHEHVDLSRCESECPRPHQHQHAPQALVAPVENRTVPETLAPECGPLQRQLRDAAEQCSDRHRGNRGQPEARHERHEHQRAGNDRHVEHRGRQRRDEEPMKRVEHSHERGGKRHEREEREHEARQGHRELELAGDAAVRRGEEIDQRVREHDPKDHEAGRDDNQSVDDVVSEPPRGLSAVGRQTARERWHERAAHRALGKQVAHEVGNAEGDVVRVHRIACAEERGQHLFADHAQNAACHRCRASRRSRARERGGGRRRGGRARRQACGGPTR